MKKILFTIGIIIVLSALAFAIASVAPAPVEREPQAQEPDSLVEYFAVRMQERFISLIGQPIEGFVPEMLTQVWPGLEASDFEGVQAMNGFYEVENGRPVFRQQEGGVITSADGAITAVGFETLLRNLAARYEMDIDGNEDIDALLLLLLEGVSQ